MKLTVSVRVLAKALRHLRSVVNAKSDCSGIKFAVVANRPSEAELSVADGKAGVWQTLWIDIGQHHGDGGFFVVPIDTLEKILQNICSADVEFFFDGEEVQILAGSGEWRMVPIDPAVFAQQPDTGGKRHLFSCAPADFAKAVRSVEHAVAKETARFTMTGMNIKADASIELVCTDGRRLAIYTINEKPKSSGSALVPNQALSILKWEDADRMDFLVSKNHVTVSWYMGDRMIATMTASQLEGRFPDYKAVIPADIGSGCVHQIEELVSAIKQVEFMSDQGDQFRVDFKYTPGKTRLSAKSGHNKGSVEVACEHSLNAEFAINPSYLRSALKAVAGPTATLHQSSKQAIVLKSDNLFQLVMPLS